MFSTPRLVPATWTPKPTPQTLIPSGSNSGKAKETTPDVCRRCGKPGHWAKDCEKQFDIWYMSMTKKEEWLQEVAIDADTKELEEEPEKEQEDFPTSSG